MKDSRWLGERTGAIPTAKSEKSIVTALSSGGSYALFQGKNYTVDHYTYVDESGEVIKYEYLYEEVANNEQ
ncbi:hypothetical protein NVP1170O_189 [Vibrio phage 1.170.O._10N.261.52.C3]|nr:hypothetical protein NVP1170O_189 [Vibrio phage 1.170.O._10N.261.52.C3]